MTDKKKLSAEPGLDIPKNEALVVKEKLAITSHVTDTLARIKEGALAFVL